jgi:hypothetical protein
MKAWWKKLDVYQQVAVITIIWYFCMFGYWLLVC